MGKLLRGGQDGQLTRWLLQEREWTYGSRLTYSTQPHFLAFLNYAIDYLFFLTFWHLCVLGKKPSVGKEICWWNSSAQPATQICTMGGRQRSCSPRGQYKVDIHTSLLFPLISSFCEWCLCCCDASMMHMQDFPNFMSYICRDFKGRHVPEACTSLPSTEDSIEENSDNSFCYARETKNSTYFHHWDKSQQHHCCSLQELLPSPIKMSSRRRRKATICNFHHCEITIFFF